MIFIGGMNLDHLIKVVSVRFHHSYYFIFQYYIHFKQVTKSTQSRREKLSSISWIEEYQNFGYILKQPQ